MEVTASQFLCMYGRVWEKYGEPVYMVESPSEKKNVGRADLKIAYMYPYASYTERAGTYFTAFQINEAVQYAQEIAAKHGASGSIERIGKHTYKLKSCGRGWYRAKKISK